MKLIINGDTVEIRVKSKYSERANKKDTLYFLNDLAIFAHEAKILNMYHGTYFPKKYYDEFYERLEALWKEGKITNHEWNMLALIAFYDVPEGLKPDPEFD